MTDARGQVYSFQPNALGWTERESWGGGSRTYTYDVSGNLKSATNRRGGVVSLTYDELDRVKTRLADGATTSYTYDSKDRFQVVANASSTDSLYFDSAGRAVRETSRGYAVQSVYNEWDQRTGLSFWNGTVSYGYNAEGQLQTITDLSGRTTKIGYNPDRQPKSWTLPTGLVITEGYLSNHGKNGIAYSVDAVDDALSVAYAQDPRGLIKTRFNATGDQQTSYGYDDAGRLTGYQLQKVIAAQYCDGQAVIDPDTGMQCAYPEEYETLASASYGYDKVGNRTDGSAAYAPGEVNRLTQFNGYTLTYDLDGNLTRKYKAGVTDQTFDWNTLGQLTKVVTNGATTSFTYDGRGRRIARYEPSRSHYYVYDGEHPYFEGSDCCLEAQYAYYPGTDRPHSIRLGGDNARVYYYATDVPGSVVGLLDLANRFVNTYHYTPWGEREAGTKETVYNPYQYTGRELDKETGLYYYRNRYYDPTLGRFLSEDPIGLLGGINLYAYAGNNPVNFRDPSGLEPCAAGSGHTTMVDQETGEEICGLEVTTGGGGDRTPSCRGPCGTGAGGYMEFPRWNGQVV